MAAERMSKYILAPQFGATGMSRNRFDDLMSYVPFSYQPTEQGELSSVHYRWLFGPSFADAINRQRETAVMPSEANCIDESISRWYGLGTTLDRKKDCLSTSPWIENLKNGCEIQDSACGRSGIMLHLELVTTAEDEVRRSGESDSQMLHGTAIACRLVAPWAGSHRVVCADSYFASVYC